MAKVFGILGRTKQPPLDYQRIADLEDELGLAPTTDLLPSKGYHGEWDLKEALELDNKKYLRDRQEKGNKTNLE